MKNAAILCGLALAACSSGAKGPAAGQTVATSHDVGPAPDTPGAPPARVERPDPALAFRQRYANPGGMWLPQQMTLPGHIETFRSMGVEIDAKTLSDPLAAPLNAVVSLGGCTASFVSPDGLIVTNHHCAQGALQFNTDKKAGQNLVEDGFLARTRAEEKSAGPAQRVFVAQAFKDVTKEVRDGLDKIKDPVARKEESEKRIKALLAACEKDRPSVRCNVKPYFGGNSYIQTENLEIRDVRLVYAPARSVGDFGGEVDNWHWPRHTGDWSFYRAYVGKDGSPADYSPDNVPFHPQGHLQVTSAGLKPGDFVMITGYPGFTGRTRTASEIHHEVEWALPYTIAFLKERYAIAESHVADESETGTKATVMKQFTQNGLAKDEGVLAGLTRGDLLAQKDDLDKRIKAWAAQPGHEAFKQAIDRLEQVGAEARRTARVDFDRRVAFDGSRLLAIALNLTHWADERTKKNEDRRPGFQERDLKPALAAQKQFARTYDRTLDRATFRLGLVRALALPEADRPWLAALLDARKGAKINEALIDKTLDAWYAAQQIEDEKLRISLLQTGTTAQLKASKDPFIKAALRVWPTVKAEEKKADARQGELLLVTPPYVEAMRQVLGGQLAPDANSSLRISYGTVRSFKPESKDPADSPLTLASQIVAKTTGKEPFNTPPKLVEAIKARKFGPYADPAASDLPIDFLCDLDITGGNSGSPILNNKAQLVGLAFDSTIEGLASDIVFDPATTRSIGVDARYMLWTLDLLDGGDHLIKEMGLTPKLP
ncbi:MAG TPA: S46 family peptidase [Kofleriaceae bacterium]|nr:S46 family peptidase [Kofleriaceae bacterium]